MFNMAFFFLNSSQLCPRTLKQRGFSGVLNYILTDNVVTFVRNKIFRKKVIYSYSCSNKCIKLKKIKNKFSSFSNYSKTFNNDDFDYEQLKNSENVFMRWKVC